MIDTQAMSTKQRHERKLLARIRVKAEHGEAAARLFDEKGFNPAFVEHRSDGNWSFCFARDQDFELSALVEAIPRHFYALQARVH